MISRSESSEEFENDNVEGFGVSEENRLDVVDADTQADAVADSHAEEVADGDADTDDNT